MTIDLLPTLAKLAGAELPKRTIDGKDIWPLLPGKPGAKSPHEAYYFYWGRELQAVRSGKWKLHFPHEYRTLKAAGSGGKPGPYVAKTTGWRCSTWRPTRGEDERGGEAPRRGEAAEDAGRQGPRGAGRLGDEGKGRGVRQPGNVS